MRFTGGFTGSGQVGVVDVCKLCTYICLAFYCLKEVVSASVMCGLRLAGTGVLACWL